MKELVTTCDHCGKKLNEMHDYVDTEFDTKDNWLCVDLCSECYAEISKTIREFCGKDQVLKYRF